MSVLPAGVFAPGHPRFTNQARCIAQARLIGGLSTSRHPESPLTLGSLPQSALREYGLLGARAEPWRGGYALGYAKQMVMAARETHALEPGPSLLSVRPRSGSRNSRRRWSTQTPAVVRNPGPEQRAPATPARCTFSSVTASREHGVFGAMMPVLAFRRTARPLAIHHRHPGDSPAVERVLARNARERGTGA